MIIFLYGPDTYRSRQKLNEIIEHYKETHKSGLNLKFFDGGKVDFQEFMQAFQQTPMFKEKKLVILKNAFLNQKFKNNFLKNSKNFTNSNDAILFYEEIDILRNDSLFKFLEKNAKTQNFKLLEGQNLKNWIKKELGRYSTKADQKTIEKLIMFLGNDLWQLSNEIKKLALYKSKGRVKEISGKDVELLIKPKIETDIFKTIDALASRNKKQALYLIHKHLEKGDSHLYLLNMINFQFRNLLTIKDLVEKGKSYNAILRITNFHSYVFKKSFWQAKKFTLQELKKIYQKIFQVDLDIKTGKIEPEIALDLLIAEI